MSCHCRIDLRSLVILVPDLDGGDRTLRDRCAEWGWSCYPDRGAIRVDLRSCYRWQSVGQVARALAAHLRPSRMRLLQAAWVSPQQDIALQLAHLENAQPLWQMVRHDSQAVVEVLSRGQVETWFQPIYRRGDTTPWGYECLLRGRTPAGEPVSPLHLIECARQENLIHMLDRVCRETHLTNAGQMEGADHLTFFVNFLPSSIYSPEDCLRTTFAALGRSGLRPEQVVLEVVETEAIADRAHLRRIVDYYRSAGFRFALDDTGSGFASLSLLADLDPDLVKIDRELVTGAVRSRVHRSVCRGLVRIARDMGRMILSEGIETAEERAVMEDLGVDLFQGFHFGRPAPLSVLTPTTRNNPIDRPQVRDCSPAVELVGGIG